MTVLNNLDKEKKACNNYTVAVFKSLTKQKWPVPCYKFSSISFKNGFLSDLGTMEQP